MNISYYSPRQGVTPSIRRKADSLIAALKHGKKVCKRLQENGYLKINVGPFWRMLSKDGGQGWILMNHQTYNREIRK